MSRLSRRDRRPAPTRTAHLNVERLEDRTVYAADPVVTITNFDADPLIGSSVTFNVSFDNSVTNAAGTTVGYGPYVNLVMPSRGADGDDGLLFDSATYLGASLTTTLITLDSQGRALHPYALGTNGLPMVFDAGPGNAGQTLVVIELPFGSFTPTQPAADIVINAHVSNLADLDQPLTVLANGGFRYGNDEFNNPATDPSVVQTTFDTETLRPQLIRLTKTYLGPEDETATGYNYPRQYRIDVEVADGQTITDLDISDLLPPNMQFVRVVDAFVNGTTPVTTTAISTPGSGTTGGTLTRRFSSVTGQAGVPDATLIFEFYVPRMTNDGNPATPESVIINEQTGDDVIGENQARAQGNWDPIDTRDPTIVAIADPAGPEHQLEEQSIAIQKGVTIVDDKGMQSVDGTVTPGDVLEFTLDVQISDYFAFENIVVDDLIADGINFDPSFAPTVVIHEHGNTYTFTLTKDPADPTRLVWSYDRYGDGALNNGDVYHPANTTIYGAGGVAAGSTHIQFRISDLMEAFGLNANLVGGGIQNETGTNTPLTGPGGPPNGALPPHGATTVQIVYRGIVQDQFTDQAPSGDRSLNPRDVLHNEALVSGAVLNVQTLTPTGYTEADDTGVELVVQEGELRKTIYSINGQAPVIAATTASVGGTYNPTGGAGGTGSFSGATTTIDGINLVTGDRVLVKNQADARQNGIYVVTDAATGAMERADDFDSNAEFKSPTVVVLSGATQANRYFRQTTVNGALNTNAVVYTQVTQPTISAGDTITYRLTYVLPTGDVEQLRLTDYLPLPVFYAIDPDGNGTGGPTWVFNTGESALPPASGHAQFLTTNTFDAVYGSAVPSITADSLGNSLNFGFGTVIDPANLPRTIDLVFTVTATDKNFTDGLFLTNQVQSSERSTQQPAVEITQNAIIQIRIAEPVVDIYKGVVGSTQTGGSNVGGVNFGAPGSPTGFTGGTVDSQADAVAIGGRNLTTGTLPDAGDRVKFAIVAYNSGRGDAFDLQISDAITSAYNSNYANVSDFVTATNFKVQRGDGTTLALGTDYTLTWDDATNTFVVTLIDNFNTSDDRTGGLNRGHDGDGNLMTDGSNAVIITYEATVASTAVAGSSAPNVATLVHYAAREGGTDQTPVDPTDRADVTIALPDVGKVLTGTSEAGNGAANAVIGERANYTLTIRIPEGQTLNSVISDFLPPGMGGPVIIHSVNLSSGVTTTNTLATGTLGSSGAFTFNSSTREMRLNFGTITNTDADNSAVETITIEFSAVVLNVMSNQGQNSPGAATTLTNSATFHYDAYNGSGVLTPRTDSATAAPVTVVEPTLSINKSVNKPSADAGDTLTYTITISNTSGYAAYDVTFRDQISALLENATITSVTASGFAGGTFIAPVSSDFVISGGAIVLNPLGVLGGDLDINSGATITITFTADVIPDIQGGQSIINTAVVDWTSLDGAVAGERTGADDQANPGAPGSPATTDPAALNNYVIQSGVVTTPVPISANKTLTGTDRTETTGNFVTPGEIVTYRITVTLPEGDTRSLSILDNIPAGMAYVPGSAVANFTGFAGYTGTSGTQPTMSVVPTTWLDGTDLRFNFTDITVPSTAGTADNVFYIEFQAVVLEVPGNSGYAPQTIITNTATLTTQVVVTPQAIPGNPAVTVQEPNLHVAQQVVVNGSGTVGDAGDSVQYTTTIRHNDGSIAGADSTLGAYDVTYVDNLPPQFYSATPPAFTVTHSTLGNISNLFEVVETSPGSGQWILRTKVDLDGNSATTDPASFDLLYGQTVTVVVNGVLSQSVTPNQSITNTASITYTNLDGDVSTTGAFDPSADVTTDHERTYNASGSSTHTVPQATITKQIVGSDFPWTTGSNVAPGETVTYAIRITLPEGTIPANMVVTDVLPPGLQYVSSSLVTTAAGALGALTNDFDGTVSAPAISTTGGPGDDVLFTFSSITVNGEQGAGQGLDNSFVILITARVLDISPNNGLDTNPGPGTTQTVLPNTASLDIPGDGVAVITTPPVNVTVVEPQLQVVKDVLNSDTTVDAGTNLNYRVVISHTGASTADAFDIRLDDLLASVGLDLTVGTISITTPTGTTLISNTSDATGVHLLFDTLRVGSQITITYTAVLNGPEDAPATVPTPGSNVVNTAVINWDHLPGPGGRAGTDDDPAQVTVNTNAISGYVYRDLNNDGLHNDGAGTALSGVRIELYDTLTNVLLGFTTTDANGFYIFDHLRPGSYYIVQPTQPTGLLDGKEQAGNVGTTFGGSTGANQGQGSDRITGIVIPADSNTTQPNYNFGELPPGSVGNFVWEDNNGNGRQDAGEPGIANVEVQLTWAGYDGVLGNADDVVFSTRTDANGLYGFGPGSSVTIVSGTYVQYEAGAYVTHTAGQSITLNGLLPANSGASNNYQLQFFTPSGYEFTTGNSAVATSATDSDVTNRATGRTAPFTIDADSSTTPALNDPTRDAGMYRPVAIGDTVWLDRNANGVQDAGEVGIPGVTVVVTWGGVDGNVATSGDNSTYTTTTDANGHYSIAGLPPGVYTVSVLTNTGPLAAGGFVRTFDRDDPTGGSTTPNNSGIVLVPSGTTDNAFDFGYRGTASLGDRVWYDYNGDGVQQAGEAGIPGVTVTLYNEGLDGVLGTADDLLIGTTTTDANGFYSFGNLLAGDYRTVVDTSTLPANAQQTFDLDGTGTAHRADRALGAGEHATNVDFGYRGTGSIGNFVWNDRDNDGAQDAGEPGIPGVTVQLTTAGLDGVLGTADDLVVATTTTDAAGGYLFSNLLDGDYRVTLVPGTLPTGLSPTFDLDGIATANRADVVLTAGARDRDDLDFGYVGPGSIGDTVWIDQNNNGVQDAGEPGIANVDLTIVYYGLNGTLGGGDDITYAVRTDANGKYSLTGLPLGNYSVTVDTSDLPAGVTTPTWDFNDQTGVVTTPNTATNIVLTIGSPNELRADFGYRGTGAIGDRVWQDRDADGVQDAGEPGLPGVTVTLVGAGVDGVYGTADDLTVVTTTDANGEYHFTNLPPGAYTVTVTDLPGSATPTFDYDDPAGSPIGTPHVAEVTLGVGETNNNVDFGYRGQGSIGDFVWTDRDSDGVQDSGEPGIPGVTVNLYGAGLDGLLGTADDLIFASTTTDATGHYLFDFLVQGLYRVAVDTSTLPGGFVPTYDLDGVAGVSAHRADRALGSAEAARDVDFGYRGTASIGDYVWQDLNTNGVQDAGEVGLPGVTVALTSAGLDGVLGTADDLVYATTTTDATGHYLFDNLLAGDYRVTIVTATLPAGAIQSYDLNGALDDRADRTIVAGEAARDVDFGYYGNGSIGDFVWNDRNANGAQDPNEPGLPGVTLQLTMAGLDGILGTADDLTYVTTTTDATGHYLFDNLLTGLYRVDVIDSTVTLLDNSDPTGLVLTTANDPLDVELTYNNSTGETLDYLDADFGYVGPGSIGDTVWFDYNGNGTQDAGEPGIADVDLTIVWHGADGVLGGGDDVTYTVRTDALGKYSLTGLPLGEYTVTLDFADLPTGLDQQTYDLTGLLDHTARVTLTTADPNEDRADFGYRGTGSIGDYVWQDLDGDGVQDAYEPALPGVTVTLIGAGVDGLYGTDDDLTVVTTTDANGLYSFDNLPPGAYTVTVTNLPGGATPTFDYDDPAGGPIGTPNSAEVTLGLGETNNNLDFGYRGNGSIGDFVWNDRDGDRVQDPNEPGIPGVTVQITGAGLDGVLGTADDLVYAPQVTDSNGRYLLDYLMAGLYRVDVIDATVAQDDAGDPTGLALTTANDWLDVTLGFNAGTGNVDDYLDADFGYRGVGSIGDLVWFDQNGDGDQDPQEYGLANVQLQITWYGLDGVLGTADDVIYTATTDANGQYNLGGLPYGQYEVSLDPTSLPNATGLNVQTYDFDGVGTPNVATVALTPAAPNETRADFGYQGVGSIGDKIFVDANLNGVYDEGEGVAGAIVTLYADIDGDGDLEAFTRTTDEFGSYLFDNLPANDVDYHVSVDFDSLPPGVTPWVHPVGAGNTDNDSYLTLTVAAPDDLAQDFGYRREGGTIGDTVYLDVNNNGIFDAGEGLAHVTVTLSGDFDGDGTINTLTTVTDDNGFYSFTGLPTIGTGPYAGPTGGVVYTVRVDVTTLPPGVAQTVDPDFAFGTPGGPLDSESTVEISDATPEYLDRDFGYRGTGAIRGGVYIDLNVDNIRTNEPGIPRVPVSLLGDFDGDGVFNNLVFTTTDRQGNFDFTGLPPGTYTLFEVRQPPQFLDGGEALNNIPLPGDTTGGPNTIPGITIALGETAINNTFGELVVPDLPTAPPPADPNGPNYVNQPRQTPIPQTFIRINPNSISYGLPDYWRVRRSGYGDGIERNLTDLRSEQYAGVAGVVYVDLNHNGVKDAWEPGVPGVEIELRGQTNRTTSTDKDGNYSFDLLPPGTYAVLEKQPKGYVDGKLSLGSVGGKIGQRDFSDIGLGAGVKGTQYNFGEIAGADLKGRTFFDINKNGRQDWFEPGVPFVVVALGGQTDLGSQETTTTITGWDGAYAFEDVRPGVYRVWQEMPGFFLTAANIPGNEGGVNNGDAIADVSLKPGSDARNYDFANRDVNLDNGGEAALNWLQRGWRSMTTALNPLLRRFGSAVGAQPGETSQRAVPTDAGWKAFGDSADGAANGTERAAERPSETQSVTAGFAVGALTAASIVATAAKSRSGRKTNETWSAILDAALDEEKN